MTTQAGAVSPYQQAAGGGITGSVINPRSTVMHDFLNVVRRLVTGRAFHTEEEVLAALRTIDSFSRIHIGSDHLRTLNETDAAPVEDVRLRRSESAAPFVQAGPPIDYAQLAAAIVAAQAAQANSPVHVITDAPNQSIPSAEEASDSQPEYPGF